MMPDKLIIKRLKRDKDALVKGNSALMEENALLEKKLEMALECLERIRLNDRGKVFGSMIRNYIKEITQMKSEVGGE